MLKIGITGGIGTGKTTACKFFENLGVPVYYADIRAKELMVENQEIIQLLKQRFGQKVYTEEGQINRSYLSSIVFKDKGALADLNAIVHPKVFEDVKNWHQQQQVAGKKYCLKESALLFETNTAKDYDKVIIVTADMENRIERVRKRDNSTRDQVLDRMDKQLPEADKIKQSDYILVNDDLILLESQIKELHEQLIRL